MRATFATMLILAALAVGACTPESKQSLPEAARIAADDRLIGTWRARILGNEYVAVVSQGAAGALDVVLRTTLPSALSAGRPPIETHHKLAFFDLVGTVVIAELGPSLVDDRTIYRFATYDIAADGSVTLRYASQDQILRFVLPLKLPGIVRSSDRIFRDVLITAESEQIAAFMGSVMPKKMFDVGFGPFARQ